MGKEYIPVPSEEEQSKREYADLFNVERELGIHDLEGQRALQVRFKCLNSQFHSSNYVYLIGCNHSTESLI